MSIDGLKRDGAILGILLIVGFLLTGEQGASAQAPSIPQGPDLLETISFMNRSVKPEVSSVSSDGYCVVDVVRNRHYDFAIPKSTSIQGRDQFGVPQYGIDWLIVQEPAWIMRINFATIEPKSVTSEAIPSVAFLKEHAGERALDLKGMFDLMLVTFDTTNSTSSIETGHFNLSSDGKSAIPQFGHQGSMGFIVFESKDRAERFVTAFVHAVELCGGKTSDFAPTPSKP